MVGCKGFQEDVIVFIVCSNIRLLFSFRCIDACWFQTRSNTIRFPFGKHKLPGTQYLFPSDVPAGFPAGYDVFLPDFHSALHLFQPFLSILRHLHFASTHIHSHKRKCRGFWTTFVEYCRMHRHKKGSFQFHQAF